MFIFSIWHIKVTLTTIYNIEFTMNFMKLQKMIILQYIFSFVRLNSTTHITICNYSSRLYASIFHLSIKYTHLALIEDGLCKIADSARHPDTSWSTGTESIQKKTNDHWKGNSVSDIGNIFAANLNALFPGSKSIELRHLFVYVIK